MTRDQGLMAVETAGAIAWFAMDACWMLGASGVAMAFAVPTVLLNVLVFRFAPRTPATWLVAGAMVAWATMNVLWMMYDFGVWPWALVAGKTCLALGALQLALAIVLGRGEAVRALVGRLRRIRLKA